MLLKKIFLVLNTSKTTLAAEARAVEGQFLLEEQTSSL
jgi:hypothetical protein